MVKTSRMPRLLLVVLLFGLAEGYSVRLNRIMPSLDLVSVGANVGALVSASVELVEDVESIGHSHGMLLLSGSRLCRELNVLREAVEGESEDLKGVAKWVRLPRKPFSLMFRLLASPLLSISLALAGLAAAMVEVFEDVRPGGHHGAALFAINELLELLVISRVVRPGRIRDVVENRVLRLSLLSGAAAMALIETVGSFGKTGAHHGVLLLAVSKLLRTVGLLRDRTKEKEE
jgi:hypothetical protein